MNNMISKNNIWMKAIYEDIIQMSCHIDKEDFYIDDNYSDMEELGKEQISTTVKNNVEPFYFELEY